MFQTPSNLASQVLPIAMAPHPLASTPTPPLLSRPIPCLPCSRTWPAHPSTCSTLLDCAIHTPCPLSECAVRLVYLYCPKYILGLSRAAVLIFPYPLRTSLRTSLRTPLRTPNGLRLLSRLPRAFPPSNPSHKPLDLQTFIAR
jgi:hypothetical protein